MNKTSFKELEIKRFVRGFFFLSGSLQCLKFEVVLRLVPFHFKKSSAVMFLEDL